jgi:hypothetical protein
MTVTLTTELENYKEKVSNLDDKAERLAPEKKLQYQEAKSTFMSRLEAWQNSIESDLSILQKNIEDGYHELESKVM